jgi:hypothetical protein
MRGCWAYQHDVVQLKNVFIEHSVMVMYSVFSHQILIFIYHVSLFVHDTADCESQ